MPKKNFVNFGDLQGFEYLKGTIVSIGDEDTCTVTVNGTDYEPVPVYYHCTPDAEERANGAIEGGSAGFAEDDEVVVLKQRPNLDDKIFVIGHLDGARHCCWVEPFDGPEITSLFPWEQIASYIRIAGGTLEDDATATIEDSVLTLTFGPTPPYEAWLEQQHGWKYDPTGTLKSSVGRILFNAEVMIDCYELGDEHREYYLYLFGKDSEDADIYFSIYVLNNNPTHSGGVPMIGCNELENEESEWTLGPYGWFKTILNNKTDYISLPVSGVSIDYALIFMTVYAPGGMSAPAGGLAGGTMKVNHIEIC